MRALWAAWARHLARTEAPTSLALFRVAVGLVLLWTLLEMLRVDAVGPVWTSLEHGGVKPLVVKQWLVVALGGPTPAVVHGLVGATAAAAACLAAGLFTRLSALVALQGAIALFSLHPFAGGGHDRLFTNALFLLLLSPAGSTLSLDAKRRTGSFVDHSARPAWTRTLLVFQLCVVYLVTGVQKLGSEWFPWGGASAVYYALLTPSWARWDLDTLAVAAARLYPLTQVGTVMAWLWEVSFPAVGLWFALRAGPPGPGRLRAWAHKVDVRAIYAGFGLMMHGALFALMELGPFSLITTSFYLLLWGPEAWARALRLRA